MSTSEAPRLGIGKVTWFGLGAVALAAAVLSFTSLQNLALQCGTMPGMAWLLPVAIDAAALVGTRVWLAPSTPGAVRHEAKRITVGSLFLSVAGNALDHFLAAYHMVPPWWAVVAVAAVPPLVLGTVAHLVANLARGRVSTRAERPADAVAVTVEPSGDLVSPADLVTDHQAGEDLVNQAARVVDRLESEGADPVGRKRLAAAMNVSEHQARQLLRQVHQARRQTLHAVGENE